MPRESEMVKGNWLAFFVQNSNAVFTDEECENRDRNFPTIFGSFMEKYLYPAYGPLLSLGAGYGGVEIPLARRGFRIIGIDNNREVLWLLKRNAKLYANNNLKALYGDLYKNFHKTFIDLGIQACVSFGVLEHFTRADLYRLIEKQFMISDQLFCTVPIKSPETLATFGAEDKPEGHIDQFGIYRNFWTIKDWEETFGEYNIIDKFPYSNKNKKGQTIDLVAFMVRK